MWWLKQGLASSVLFVKRGAYLVIFLLSLGALLTNRLMLTYPNYFFQDPQRFVQEKKFEERFVVLAQSASLIKQLTHETQKVVLLSNFETALLMQAQRQPLFDNFPVMFSSFSNGPGGLNLKTKEQCLNLIKSIQEENAMYVFIDERLLALSPQTLQGTGLKAVLDYLNIHYKEYTHQGFLLALQRR
jgi:hypothetical protein